MPTDPLTPDEIAEARRLCDAASNAPWTVIENIDRANIARAVVGDGWQVARCVTRDEAHSKADAAFIAAARALLPRLLDDLEATRKKYSDLLAYHPSLIIAEDGTIKTCPEAMVEDYRREIDTNVRIAADLAIVGAERDALMSVAKQICAWANLPSVTIDRSHATPGSFPALIDDLAALCCVPVPHDSALRCSAVKIIADSVDAEIDAPAGRKEEATQ